MSVECLLCKKSVEPFLNFGSMPIANGFLKQEEFAKERFYNLSIGFCENCRMTQLTSRIPAEELFHGNYAYFSSISNRMAKHFEAFAYSVMEGDFLAPDPLIVELGSNDGIMLKNFATKGIRHVGIEPSENVAKAAIQNGVNTLCVFFNEKTAQQIADEYGKADAILGANVMCHIPDLHSVLRGVKVLLKPTGRLIFEDPYLGEIIRKTAYDQIYDEHYFYFSLSSLDKLLKQYGLEVIDVAPQEVHGGSMRYTIGFEGSQAVSGRVADLRNEEKAMGLEKPETFKKFAEAVKKSRCALNELLSRLVAHGNRVVGYGATSKSTTVTNYCGITPDLIEFISDTTAGKQGKYSPGVHIPVKPYQEFEKKYPDYALLFAWNHGEEIMAMEKAFEEAGGKWITYIPEVRIIA